MSDRYEAEKRDYDHNDCCNIDLILKNNQCFTTRK